MTTKADLVKAALDECYAWYEKLDCNIRTYSERIDAMWHEVNFHVKRLEQAEREQNEKAATEALERVIHFVTRILAEAEAARA